MHNEELLKEHINDLIFYIAINFWYVFLLLAIIFMLVMIKFLKDYLNLQLRVKRVNSEILEPLAKVQNSEEMQNLLTRVDSFFSLVVSGFYVKRGDIYFLDIFSHEDKEVVLPQRIYQKDIVEEEKSDSCIRYIFMAKEVLLVVYTKNGLDIEYDKGVFDLFAAYYEKIVTRIHRNALEMAQERSKDIMKQFLNIRSTTETFLEFVVSLLHKKADAQMVVVGNQENKKEKTFRFGMNPVHKKRFFIRNTPYIVDIYTQQPLAQDIIDEIGKFLDVAGSYFENVDRDSKMVQNYIEFLRFWVQSLEMQSRYFVNHSLKVKTVSIEIAKNLFMDEKNITRISLGAELHDVGMIGKISSLLDKSNVEKSKLDLVKYHPVIGGMLVEPINGAYPIVDIIRYHHERYDGRGYPYGISGKDFPINAQIVALAEYYVGITSARAYRPAVSHEKALEKIQMQKDMLVQERIIDAFIEGAETIKKKLDLIDAKHQKK